MTVLFIFISVFELFLILVLVFVIKALNKRYKILNDMFEFYDKILNELIKTATTVDEDATRILNKSLIEGYPEVKKLFMYIRNMRDTYRKLTKEYNNKNIYGNKVIIEELND